MIAPTVLGHEAAGVVEAVGAGVTDARARRQGRAVADRRRATSATGACAASTAAASTPASVTTGTLADGHTPLSRHGKPVLRGVGVGGFAEYVITPESGAIKVADDTPLEIVCVIGCAVQTGVGAVLNTAKVPEGATVLVAGGGGIGISIMQGARIAGATTHHPVRPGRASGARPRRTSARPT